MWGLQLSQPQGHDPRRAQPAFYLLVSGADEGEMFSTSPSSFTTYGKWEGWLQDHERTGHIPH